MNVRWFSFLAGLIFLALVPMAFGQGFGGLGANSKGFDTPQRGKEFEFPKDHGAHTNFRIEWWYLTANLKDENGADLGIQWTLFRSSLKPRDNNQPSWKNAQLWMAHAAVTTPDGHFVEERRARGGIGQAGVSASPFKAWIDDWSFDRVGEGDKDELDNVRLTANADKFSYDLKLTANGPLVRHGENGYSVKSPNGQASYYYSQPSYQVEGEIILDGKPVTVSGSAWLDREWSSQPLESDQKGWDWVSLNFDDGQKLMGFRVRQDGKPPFTAATLIGSDGKPVPLANGELVMMPQEHSAVAGRKVPTQWQISIPSKDISISLSALNPNSWMKTSIPYWEGPVLISGSKSGRGYLEMTGY